jgi:hypothetical protein
MVKGNTNDDIAIQRYGPLKQPNIKPKDEPFPKDPEGRPGAKNFGDIPVNSWLRGGGESAEGRLGYGRSKPRER